VPKTRAGRTSGTSLPPAVAHRMRYEFNLASRLAWRMGIEWLYTDSATWFSRAFQGRRPHLMAKRPIPCVGPVPVGCLPSCA
jgi:hypothetical protein